MHLYKKWLRQNLHGFEGSIYLSASSFITIIYCIIKRFLSFSSSLSQNLLEKAQNNLKEDENLYSSMDIENNIEMQNENENENNENERIDAEEELEIDLLDRNNTTEMDTEDTEIDTEDTEIDTEDTKNDTEDSSNSLINKENMYITQRFSPIILTKTLLVMAIKLRHSLTYSAAEDILRLLNIMTDSNFSLSSKYFWKKIIKIYSDYLTIHHLCNNYRCGAYIGQAQSDNINLVCPYCHREINAKTNLKAGNTFLHLSLKKQLTHFFELFGDQCLYSEMRKKTNYYDIEDIYDGECYIKGNENNMISLNFSVDGTPIFDSSASSIHPVLCTINELAPTERKKHIMLTCLWFGNKKVNMNDYLIPFVEEAKELYYKGFNYFYNGKMYHKRVRILAGNCDSVERPLLQCCTQFNGSYGCGLCLNPGKSILKGKGHVMVYLVDDNDNAFGMGLRTHTGTLHDAINKTNGIKDRSILCNIPEFDIINNLHVEWMHCVALGVCRQFIKMWFDSRYHQEHFYLGNFTDRVDKILLSYKPSLEVSRTPRKISDYKHWKAHEFVIFLLFYSIPIFKEFFSRKFLHHWSLLVDAISILLKTSIKRSEIWYAEKCLLQFVKEVQILYGKKFMSFNVHLLIHLPQSVLKWGPLWAHSAFCYEDFNQELQNYVKSSNGVARQICDTFRIKYVVMKLRLICAPWLNETQINYLDKVLCKKNKPEVTENVGNFGMLGSAIMVSKLSGNHYLALQRSNVAVQQDISGKYYQRILINNEIIHSKQYSKVKKRCSYFVILKNSKIFEIDTFLITKVENCEMCYAIGYYYLSENTPLVPNKRLSHLIVLKQKINYLAAVNICNIKEKITLIKSKFFNIAIACLHPNHIELLA